MAKPGESSVNSSPSQKQDEQLQITKTLQQSQEVGNAPFVPASDQQLVPYRAPAAQEAEKKKAKPRSFKIVERDRGLNERRRKAAQLNDLWKSMGPETEEEYLASWPGLVRSRESELEESVAEHQAALQEAQEGQKAQKAADKAGQVSADQLKSADPILNAYRTLEKGFRGNLEEEGVKAALRFDDLFDAAKQESPETLTANVYDALSAQLAASKLTDDSSLYLNPMEQVEKAGEAPVFRIMQRNLQGILSELKGGMDEQKLEEQVKRYHDTVRELPPGFLSISDLDLRRTQNTPDKKVTYVYLLDCVATTLTKIISASAARSRNRNGGLSDQEAQDPANAERLRGPIVFAGGNVEAKDYKQLYTFTSVARSAADKLRSETARMADGGKTSLGEGNRLENVLSDKDSAARMMLSSIRQKLDADKGSDSDQFLKLRSTFTELTNRLGGIGEKGQTPLTTSDYKMLVTDAANAAKQYLEKNSGNRLTSKGQQRQALGKEIADFLQSLLKADEQAADRFSPEKQQAFEARERAERAEEIRTEYREQSGINGISKKRLKNFMGCDDAQVRTAIVQEWMEEVLAAAMRIDGEGRLLSQSGDGLTRTPADMAFERSVVRSKIAAVMANRSDGAKIRTALAKISETADDLRRERTNSKFLLSEIQDIIPSGLLKEEFEMDETYRRDLIRKGEIPFGDSLAKTAGQCLTEMAKAEVKKLTTPLDVSEALPELKNEALKTAIGEGKFEEFGREETLNELITELAVLQKQHPQTSSDDLIVLKALEFLTAPVKAKKKEKAEEQKKQSEGPGDGGQPQQEEKAREEKSEAEKSETKESKEDRLLREELDSIGGALMPEEAEEEPESLETQQKTETVSEEKSEWEKDMMDRLHEYEERRDKAAGPMESLKILLRDNRALADKKGKYEQLQREAEDLYQALNVEGLTEDQKRGALRQGILVGYSLREHLSSFKSRKKADREQAAEALRQVDRILEELERIDDERSRAKKEAPAEDTSASESILQENAPKQEIPAEGGPEQTVQQQKKTQTTVQDQTTTQKSTASQNKGKEKEPELVLPEGFEDLGAILEEDEVHSGKSVPVESLTEPEEEKFAPVGSLTDVEETEEQETEERTEKQTQVKKDGLTEELHRIEEEIDAEQAKRPADFMTEVRSEATVARLNELKNKLQQNRYAGEKEEGLYAVMQTDLEHLIRALTGEGELTENQLVQLLHMAHLSASAYKNDHFRFALRRKKGRTRIEISEEIRQLLDGLDQLRRNQGSGEENGEGNTGVEEPEVSEEELQELLKPEGPVLSDEEAQKQIKELEEQDDLEEELSEQPVSRTTVNAQPKVQQPKKKGSSQPQVQTTVNAQPKMQQPQPTNAQKKTTVQKNTAKPAAAQKTTGAQPQGLLPYTNNGLPLQYMESKGNFRPIIAEGKNSAAFTNLMQFVYKDNPKMQEFQQNGSDQFKMAQIPVSLSQLPKRIQKQPSGSNDCWAYSAHLMLHSVGIVMSPKEIKRYRASTNDPAQRAKAATINQKIGSGERMNMSEISGLFPIVTGGKFKLEKQVVPIDGSMGMPTAILNKRVNHIPLTSQEAKAETARKVLVKNARRVLVGIVQTAVASGSAISVISGNHYQTITGVGTVDQETCFMVEDSLSGRGEIVTAGQFLREAIAAQVSDNAGQIELAWLKKN